MIFDINKSTLMWIIIAILLVSIIYLTLFKSSGTGQVVGADGKLDTTGWTENEKMNYEMHGTIPARVKGSTSGSSGMVGGC